MAQVKIEVSPEYFFYGQIVADVKVSIPTSLLQIASELSLMGENLGVRWGHWEEDSEGQPFRYKKMPVSRQEVPKFVEIIKEYAKEMREKERTLNLTSETIILEL